MRMAVTQPSAPRPQAELPALFLQNTNFREPVQQLSQQQVEERSLKYYNSDIHRAAFILPEFARKVSKAVCYCSSKSEVGFLQQQWEHTGLQP